MEPDERRSAALLAWPDADVLPSAALEGPFRGLAVPSLPRRFFQEVALKRGWLAWDRHDEAMLTARREALGAAAEGPPRALIRVDELPHARGFDPAGRFGTDAYRRFHAVLAEAGVPYLLAITPRVSRDFLDPAVEEWRPLDDGEIELLHELRRDGVVFALHGLDHRTRHESGRRHSELCGLSVAATEERIDTGLAAFAARFEVVCGGPESVRLLGFQPPGWRGDAVYLPSYRPLYGWAHEAVAELGRLAELRTGLWAPVTLHWGWELQDELAALRRLCSDRGELVVGWTELLAAVAATREA